MSEKPGSYSVNRKVNMDAKTLKLLHESQAVKSVTIKAEGAHLYIQFKLKSGDLVTVNTTRGKVKHWSTFDAAIKWLKNLGIGYASIDMTKWNKEQKQLDL